MQEVTDRDFMALIAQYRAPDFYITEYFRVYANSRLDRHILRAITENTTNRPVFAQLIGEHLPDLQRIAQELQTYPIAGIDLNLGCPAPRVYRKNVGGGLLREPETVDRLLAGLREVIPVPFTVKMRVGFADLGHFSQLLTLLARHGIDRVSLHGRTVKEGYRGEVRYEAIAQAVQTLPCPVIANGNVDSAAKAQTVLARTGAAGVMIGRGAIANPWIFRQIHDVLRGHPPYPPTYQEAYAYLQALADLAPPHAGAPQRLARLKKYANFVGTHLNAAFLQQMRRSQTLAEFWEICGAHLLTQPQTA
ncbi:MAG TPA: dihydrouridine synthase [Cyanobacteria bacterium UBA8156]|nr:dihydrouridine synthase [Cyanobacteria bacterium UBA8156]